MIIFDLDGTLADCEHRRHFVDSNYNPPDCKECENTGIGIGGFCYCYHGHPVDVPDWESFYEACDKDTPIESVISIWNDQISLGGMGKNQIWSGRCESTREKTEEWLDKNLLSFESHQLKMRPIGDYTPDDELKEKWLDEAINSGNKIDFVFDDRPKVVRMWRRRGVFVFNCNQEE